MTSGNPIVDQMEQITIVGDAVCANWYKWIVRITNSGKETPDLLAIIILSNICYWYKPTIIRDERTDNIVDKKKKFSFDYLQKQYSDYAEMYGQPKSAVKSSMDTLEELGLIKRHFRDYRLDNGTILNNRMYIEIIPEKIKEITFNDPPSKFSYTLPQKRDIPSSEIQVESPAKNEVYTENTTKITTKDTTTTPDTSVVDENIFSIFSPLKQSLSNSQIKDIYEEAHGDLAICEKAVSFINNYKGKIYNLPGLIISFIRNNYSFITRNDVKDENNRAFQQHSNYNWDFIRWQLEHEREGKEAFIESAEQVLGYKLVGNVRDDMIKINQLVSTKLAQSSTSVPSTCASYL